EAEPFEIVEGVAERVDLELAAVAGAGVDMPDRETAPERPLGGFGDRRRERGELRVVVPWRSFRHRRPEALQQRVAHLRGRIPSRSSRTTYCTRGSRRRCFPRSPPREAAIGT